MVNFGRKYSALRLAKSLIFKRFFVPLFSEATIMFGVWRSLARATTSAEKFAHEFERASRLDEAGALAHKLKGSARGIGAFAVAEAAAHLECAIRTGDNPPHAFATLKETVAEVRAAIETLLRGS